MGRFIKLDKDNIVISERIGPSIIAGEIESLSGKLGQVLQGDGSFITPEPIPVEPVPTVAERLTNIEDTQDLILLKLDGVIA